MVDIDMRVAKEAAKVMHASTIGVPNATKIEAAILLLRALMVEYILPANCLQVYDKAVKRLRTDIESDLKKKAGRSNGKKRRSH
jgi:hypothetical protein